MRPFQLTTCLLERNPVVTRGQHVSRKYHTIGWRFEAQAPIGVIIVFMEGLLFQQINFSSIEKMTLLHVVKYTETVDTIKCAQVESREIETF